MTTFFVDSIETEKKRDFEINQAKIERLKLVRQQEIAISKRNLQEKAIKDEELRKKQEFKGKFTEYRLKLQQIEELNKVKSQNLKEIGIFIRKKD
jgi:predicted transcriptional regulator